MHVVYIMFVGESVLKMEQGGMREKACRQAKILHDALWYLEFELRDLMNENVGCLDAESCPLQLQVCSTPMTSGKTQYALTIAEDIVRYYEELYQVDYPLPKLG